MRNTLQILKLVDPTQYHMMKYCLFGYILFFINLASSIFFINNRIHIAFLISFYTNMGMGFIFLQIIQYYISLNDKKVNKVMDRLDEDMINLRSKNKN